MRWTRYFFSLWAFTILGLRADDDEVETENPRKVQGQQYVKQRMIAKIVGAEGISDDLLSLINQDGGSGLSQNATLVFGQNSSEVPQLITENVKTTVTRITIPLSTSFMDSEWYRDTLKKFIQKNKIAIMNSSGGKQYSENGTDVDLVMLKLWAAATLRDNIVTVFGYLLYHQTHILPGDLHSSLVQLYNVIRLRRVSTIGMLDVLQAMSFERPQTQFILLFEQLDKFVPKYLRSCVTYWLENLHARNLNLDEILTLDKGALAVDFLSGIDSSALLALRQQLLFPKSTVLNSSKTNEQLLGKTLAYVMSGIAERNVFLTQKLFAGILLHLPLNKLPPEVDEYERYIFDLLKKGERLDEKTFNRAVQKLKLDELSNPFDLVKSILRAILPSGMLNSEQIEVILTSIENTTTTYSLTDYDVISPIISSDKINMEVLLSGIVAEEYPPDVVDAKDRLLYYIDKRYIDLAFVLRGFIKHKHTTATELLIATLTRMEIRALNLPKEVASTISTLKAHIIFKRALNNLRLTLSVVDITTLLSSFQSPLLPPAIRVTVAELKLLLQTERIDFQYQLNKQSTAQCSRPRQCVINIFKFLLNKGQIRNKQCELKIRELLKLVDPNGEPIVIQRRSMSSGKNCIFGGDLDIDSITVNTETEETLDVFKKIVYKEGSKKVKEIYPGKYNPSPYKNDDPKNDVYELPIYISRQHSEIIITGHDGEIFYRSDRPDLGDVTFSRVPLPHPGWINNITTLEQLLPVLESNSADERKLVPVKRLLQEQDLQRKLNINTGEYLTRGGLLLKIIKGSLNQTELFRDEQQRASVQAYATLLEYSYQALPPPPPASTNQQKREVNYLALIQAVPVPNDEASVSRIEKLKSYLTSANLTKALDNFDFNRYPTKGSFLKHMFQYLLETNATAYDAYLTDAIRYFEKRVRTAGYGAQPVEWQVVLHKVVSNTNDLNEVFSIIDPKLLPKQAKKSLYLIFNFLVTDFSPSDHMTGFDMTAYRTKGEYLSAFLNHLSAQPLSSDLLTAISVIKPFVETSPQAGELVHIER